ncbi:hypothetical protein BT69DRAFT_388644 [Atractiella rhizophila]|nr:hypothetical protein BT69DRAFT_552004 [Atractiella rhizophila]KAH8928962.1 hypothetical protein BT69DRAFT_388644 [Atractiella rhizophila]
MSSGQCNLPSCDRTGSLRCSRCKTAFYCSGEHQKTAWPTHKAECKPAAPAPAPTATASTNDTISPATGNAGSDSSKHMAPGFLSRTFASDSSSYNVTCIRSFCDSKRILPEWNKAGEDWQSMSVSSQDSIFNNDPLPLSVAIGFPLVIRREEAVKVGDENDQGLRNKPIRWLTIEKETGDAPKIWKGNIGNVVVARADKKSLNIYQFEAAWKFCEDIADRVGFSTKMPKVVEKRLNRETFEGFYKQLRRDKVGQHEWEESPLTLE